MPGTVWGKEGIRLMQIPAPLVLIVRLGGGGRRQVHPQIPVCARWLGGAKSIVKCVKSRKMT